MELHYTVSEEDYIQFNLFHYANSKTMKQQRLMVGILMPILLLLIGIITARRLDVFSLLVAGLFELIWFGFGGRMYKKTVSRNVRKLMKEGKINEFIGVHTLSLSDEKICMADTRKTTEFPYESIQRIESDYERFYIYTGAISALIIPFSAFDSGIQKQNFIDTLKQKAHLSL